jgi:predicted phage terminase large subunit-like protein
MSDVAALLAQLSPEQRLHLDWQRKWRATARPNQIVDGGDWTECGYLAGRGFGKTRVGAEWITRAVFEDPSGFDSCVIAPTYQDVKFTCFEGESGILSVLPPDLLVEYNKSDTIIRMKNVAGGISTIRGFTAEKPERLRGPQHCRGWFDELAAWQYDQDTWDMAMFGMRLGDKPQVLWTTTPKPKEMIRKLSVPAPGRIIVRGSTFDNKANLPDSFFKQLEQYEGTTLGRQELYGELIDPEESGIIRRSWFRLWPAKNPLPKFDWIIMSLDTAYTEKSIDKKGDPDPTACGVWGVFTHEKRSNVMLLDCWEDHLGLPELMRRVKRELNTPYGEDDDTALIKPLFGSAKPMTSGRKPDILLIEDKGSGISLRQMLAESGIEAYAYNPGRADKLSRLHIVSPIFAQKRVWLPESEKNAGRPRTWCDPVVTQLCSFTGEGSIKHDDHVDQTTQAMRLCMDKGLIKLIKDTPIIAPPPKFGGANPYAA